MIERVVAVVLSKTICCSSLGVLMLLLPSASGLATELALARKRGAGTVSITSEQKLRSQCVVCHVLFFFSLPQDETFHIEAAPSVWILE